MYIYTVLKSTNESRVQYCPEPTPGKQWSELSTTSAWCTVLQYAKFL